MKTGFWSRYLACCLTACCWTSAMAADVVKARIDSDPGRSVLGRLLSSFDMHAAAARRWYVHALDGRRVEASEFGLFSHALQTDRMVSFTYDYVRNGQRRSRVYQGRSGKNHPWLLVKASRGTGTYASYFSRLETDTVVWDREWLPRGHDAERKVARQIERDIRNGVVEGGGRLYGFASSEMCAACEASLKALSDKRGIHVHVAYFAQGGAHWRRFDRLRRQYIASIFAAVNGVELKRPWSHAAAGTPVFDCLDHSDEEDE